MWERVCGSEPAVWGEHGQPSRLDGRADPAVAIHQRGLGETGGQRVRVLVHPEHRHPMGCVFADLDPLKHLADRVGERSAARQQYDPAAPPERG